MIEFLMKYFWWIGWLILTPFVLFCAIVYYILITFDKYKFDLDDINWDEYDKEAINLMEDMMIYYFSLAWFVNGFILGLVLSKSNFK